MAHRSFDDSLDVAMGEFELLYGACEEDDDESTGSRHMSRPTCDGRNHKGSSNSPESSTKAVAREKFLDDACKERRAKPQREENSRNRVKTATKNQKRTSLELDLQRLQQLYGGADEKEAEAEVLPPAPSIAPMGRTKRQESQAAARALSSRLLRDAKERNLRRQVSMDERPGKCHSPVGPKTTKITEKSPNPNAVSGCHSTTAKSPSRSGRALTRKSSNAESGKCYSPVGPNMAAISGHSPTPRDNGGCGSRSTPAKSPSRSGRALTRKSSNATESGKCHSPKVTTITGDSTRTRDNGGRPGRDLMRKSSNSESYRQKSERDRARSTSRCREGLSHSEHRCVRKTRSTRTHNTTESSRGTSLSPRKLRKPAQDSNNTVRKPEGSGKSGRTKSRDASSVSPRKIRKQDTDRNLSEKLAKPRKPKTMPLNAASTAESGPPLGRRDFLRSSV